MWSSGYAKAHERDRKNLLEASLWLVFFVVVVLTNSLFIRSKQCSRKRVKESLKQEALNCIHMGYELAKQFVLFTAVPLWLGDSASKSKT
jgi:hypothetical protein